MRHLFSMSTECKEKQVHGFAMTHHLGTVDIRWEDASISSIN